MLGARPAMSSAPTAVPGVVSQHQDPPSTSPPQSPQSFALPLPNISTLDDASAQLALARLVAAKCAQAGFQGADAAVFRGVVEGVQDFLQATLLMASDHASSSSRRLISVHDVMLSLDSQPGYSFKDLSAYIEKNRGGDSAASARTPSLGKLEIERPKRTEGELPEWAAKGEDWIDSEEELESSNEAAAQEGDKGERKREARKRVKRRRIRMAGEVCPDHLPDLPQLHAWMETPVYPTSASAGLAPLERLNFKLSSARLVEASLRRLIRATDQAALEAERRSTSAATETAGDGAAASGGVGGANARSRTRVRTVTAGGRVFGLKRSEADKSVSPNSGSPAPMEGGGAGTGAAGSEGGSSPIITPSGASATAPQAPTTDDAPPSAASPSTRVRAPKLSLRLRTTTNQTAKASGISEPQLVSAKVLGSGGGAATSNLTSPPATSTTPRRITITGLGGLAASQLSDLGNGQMVSSPSSLLPNSSLAAIAAASSPVGGLYPSPRAPSLGALTTTPVGLGAPSPSSGVAGASTTALMPRTPSLLTPRRTSFFNAAIPPSSAAPGFVPSNEQQVPPYTPATPFAAAAGALYPFVSSPAAVAGYEATAPEGYMTGWGTAGDEVNAPTTTTTTTAIPPSVNYRAASTSGASRRRWKV